MNTDALRHRTIHRMPHDMLATPLSRGGTVLMIEDSRFSSESIRLMLRGSGGRLRRVDTLSAARRHLSLYTPDVVLVDLGLPDGCGLDLIGEIDRKRPRVPLIIAVSGQPELEQSALDAGADRFLAKPFASMADFRAMLAPLFFPLRHACAAGQIPAPDHAALRDDLLLALDLISGPSQIAARDYALQFIEALARSLSDGELARSVETVRDEGGSLGQLVAPLRARLRDQPLI